MARSRSSMAAYKRATVHMVLVLSASDDGFSQLASIVVDGARYRSLKVAFDQVRDRIWSPEVVEVMGEMFVYKL